MPKSCCGAKPKCARIESDVIPFILIPKLPLYDQNKARSHKKRVQKFWGVKFVTPFRKLWWRHHFRNRGIRKFTFQAFRQYRHVIVPTLSFNAKKIQDGERAVCCFLIVFVIKTIKGKSWHFWSNRVRGAIITPTSISGKLTSISGKLGIIKQKKF